MWWPGNRDGASSPDRTGRGTPPSRGLRPIRGASPMTPLQTIAVGFDGSPDAEAAVRWAFELARQVDARVFVVHAVGLLEHATNRKVAAELEKTVRGLTRETGLDPARVRWHRSDGDLCSVLLRAAVAPIAADLLVVGSRGQGGARRAPPREHQPRAGRACRRSVGDRADGERRTMIVTRDSESPVVMENRVMASRRQKRLHDPRSPSAVGRRRPQGCRWGPLFGHQVSLLVEGDLAEVSGHRRDCPDRPEGHGFTEGLWR